MVAGGAVRRHCEAGVRLAREIAHGYNRLRELPEGGEWEGAPASRLRARPARPREWLTGHAQDAPAGCPAGIAARFRDWGRSRFPFRATRKRPPRTTTTGSGPGAAPSTPGRKATGCRSSGIQCLETFLPLLWTLRLMGIGVLKRLMVAQTAAPVGSVVPREPGTAGRGRVRQGGAGGVRAEKGREAALAAESCIERLSAEKRSSGTSGGLPSDAGLCDAFTVPVLVTLRGIRLENCTITRPWRWSPPRYRTVCFPLPPRRNWHPPQYMMEANSSAFHEFCGSWRKDKRHLSGASCAWTRAHMPRK
jgi:hypothetical protein